MFNALEFEQILTNIYARGGNPEYLVIDGIGELYWPALTTEEKSFVIGWLSGQKHEKEKNGKKDME